MSFGHLYQEAAISYYQRANKGKTNICPVKLRWHREVCPSYLETESLARMGMAIVNPQIFGNI